MKNYSRIFNSYLTSIKKQGQYRVFFEHERTARHPIVIKDQKKYITWCSNDYLGLSQHPLVIQSAVKAAFKNGVGAGGTRNISGSSVAVTQLEQEIAKFHQCDSSLTFSSAFAANYGMLGALGQLIPELHFFSDADNHASIVDGIRAAKKNVTVFKHNNTQQLANMLQEQTGPSCIVTESIFSMDGSCAPLTEIVELANKHRSLLCVDEVHAIGLYGHKGNGLVSNAGLTNKVDVVISGFGKAFGTQGGYIVGQREIIDSIRLAARPFIFSTANAIPIVQATRTSLHLLQNMGEERKHILSNTRYLNNKLRSRGIPTLYNNETHILCVPVSGAEECKQVSTELIHRGHYIQPINFPTVPIGQERLRITPSHLHTKDMMNSLVDAFLTSLPKTMSSS